MEKVAERINQSVDLKVIENDRNQIPETKEEYMKSKNTLRSFGSEKSIKRGSVDL